MGGGGGGGGGRQSIALTPDNSMDNDYCMTALCMCVCMVACLD